MSDPKEITKADAHVAVHVRGLASDFAAAKEIASHREWAAYAERERVLDEVERNLRRILADDRAEQVHTIRDVLTVLVDNALPKWREG